VRKDIIQGGVLMKQPAVYMMANKCNGTIYTGVTSNLIKRVYEHKYALIDGFTKKYDCKLLVFYETCDIMISAIAREKQIKAGSRKNKIKLIESINPEWRDLYENII
jgi:predicted GIY-YIG superfamily endonuclease